MTTTWLACLLACAVASSGCDSTSPDPLTPPTAPSAWPSDSEQIANSLAQELRAAGMDVALAERLGRGPLSVGGYRLVIQPRTGDVRVPDDMRVYVYYTAEQAASEADRLNWEGNLDPLPGEFPSPHVTYVIRQHFHHRGRVIAVYSGCGTTHLGAMASLFGPPIVVAEGVVDCTDG